MSNIKYTLSLKLQEHEGYLEDHANEITVSGFLEGISEADTMIPHEMAELICQSFQLNICGSGQIEDRPRRIHIARHFAHSILIEDDIKTLDIDVWAEAKAKATRNTDKELSG